MAKKPRPPPPATASPTQPQTSLAKARWALEAGDIRRARALLSEVVRSGPDADRADAQAMLKRLGPDPVAILTAAAVLVLIVIAAWLAILRAH